MPPGDALLRAPYAQSARRRVAMLVFIIEEEDADMPDARFF